MARKRIVGTFGLDEISQRGFRIWSADQGAELGVRISSALEAKARKQPLVVAADEAHSLRMDPGRALLHSVQLVRRTELPLILALSGTPELPRRLNSMESTFWDRSEILRIGLLNRTAAADAIRIPLEKYGRRSMRAHWQKLSRRVLTTRISCNCGECYCGKRNLARRISCGWTPWHS